MDCGGDSSNVTKERIRKRDLLVHDHINHTHNPGGVKKSQLGRASPESVGNGKVGVMLSADNVQERMIEDGVDGVVRELLLEPRRPVVPVVLQLCDLALVELGAVVAMADGDAVLRLHEVGEHLGIHGVVAPGLGQDLPCAVGDVLSHLTPDPGEVNAGVPDAGLGRIRAAQVVHW